jgi:hypothetical protein
MRTEAILKARPVMVRGKERFLITGWENVMAPEDLPFEYVTRFPRFATYDETMLLLETEKQPITGFPSTDNWGDHRKFWIHKGVTVLTPEGFGNLLATMKKAGDRLMEINRDIKKRAEKWEGPEKEYVI